MKKRLITYAFTFCVLHVFGQSVHNAKTKHASDSIREKHLDGLAWKNPILRQAGISTEVLAPGNITSDLYDHSFMKGTYKAWRTNAYFTVPIVRRGRNIFSATVAAGYQSMELYDVTSYDPSVPVSTNQVHNTLLTTVLSYTHIDSLFHRPVVYSLSATGLVNPETGQYRYGFAGVMTLALVQTKRSTLSVGLMVIHDPSVSVPVIPFISYYHKFRSPRLEFFLDPSRIALRKELNARNSIALSNNIGGNLSLFKFQTATLPGQQAFSTLEMKSGLIYEHLLTRKMVVSLSGGVSSTLASKVLEESKFTDPFIKNTQAMVPYVKMGISFLPFWKGIIH